MLAGALNISKALTCHSSAVTDHGISSRAIGMLELGARPPIVHCDAVKAFLDVARE